VKDRGTLLLHVGMPKEDEVSFGQTREIQACNQWIEKLNYQAGRWAFTSCQSS